MSKKETSQDGKLEKRKIRLRRRNERPRRLTLKQKYKEDLRFPLNEKFRKILHVLLGFGLSIPVSLFLLNQLPDVDTSSMKLSENLSGYYYLYIFILSVAVLTTKNRIHKFEANKKNKSIPEIKNDESEE